MDDFHAIGIGIDLATGQILIAEHIYVLVGFILFAAGATLGLITARSLAVS